MAFLQRLEGQSNYDMCLMCYGSLDKLVKLCKDNNITDINIPKSGNYYYDKNEIVDITVVGYPYSTQRLP